MFRRRNIIGSTWGAAPVASSVTTTYNTVPSVGYASTIPSVGYSGLGSTGYGTTITAPKKRFGFFRRFGLRRGFGTQMYGGARLGLWQRLKLRLGFGKVHYGAGSTITAKTGGWGVPATTVF